MIRVCVMKALFIQNNESNPTVGDVGFLKNCHIQIVTGVRLRNLRFVNAVNYRSYETSILAVNKKVNCIPTDQLLIAVARARHPGFLLAIQWLNQRNDGLKLFMSRYLKKMMACYFFIIG